MGAKRTFNPHRLTYIAKVQAVYESLQFEGNPDPSEREVLKSLGRGSPNDVNGAMKIIRGELWQRHEPIVIQTRYTGEETRPPTGASPTKSVDDPTVEPKR